MFKVTPLGCCADRVSVAKTESVVNKKYSTVIDRRNRKSPHKAGWGECVSTSPGYKNCAGRPDSNRRPSLAKRRSTYWASPLTCKWRAGLEPAYTGCPRRSHVGVPSTYSVQTAQWYCLRKTFFIADKVSIAKPAIVVNVFWGENQPLMTNSSASIGVNWHEPDIIMRSSGEASSKINPIRCRSAQREQEWFSNVFSIIRRARKYSGAFVFAWRD